MREANVFETKQFGQHVVWDKFYDEVAEEIHMVGLRCVAGSGIWGAVILRGCCVLEYKGFPAVLVDASWCCGLHGERGGGGGGFDAGGKMRGEGFDANETLLNDKQHVREQRELGRQGKMKVWTTQNVVRRLRSHSRRCLF